MMKLTKYNHACFTVEKDGEVIVVDPGNFSSDFIAPQGVVAVVITHQHADHFDHDQITAIIDKNPEAVIVAHPSITEQVEVFQTRSVEPNEEILIGDFSLKFYGGEHALIHESLPTVANLGVMIDELLYYPGDSFTLPADSVDTLALPAVAPWMKISEAMDFLVAVKPRLAFPTHDAIASDLGKQLADQMLGEVAAKNDSEYVRLTEPVTI